MVSAMAWGGPTDSWFAGIIHSLIVTYITEILTPRPIKQSFSYFIFKYCVLFIIIFDLLLSFIKITKNMVFIYKLKILKWNKQIRNNGVSI